MSDKSGSRAIYGDIYKNLNGLDLNLEDIGISYAFLKRACINTLQQILSMNWDELENIPGRSHIGIDHIVEKLQELSEISGESKDALMAAVAIKSMKLFKLSDEIVEAFERRREVKVSNQVCIGKAPDGDEFDEIKQIGSHISYKGLIFSLSVTEPSEQQVKKIIEEWGQYGGEPGLIYHVNRLEINGRVIYTVFYVDTNSDGWEKDEREISDGELWGYVSRMGDENWQWADYEKASVKSVKGCVFRADFPVYKKETLRFIKDYESEDMREFLRSRPDTMNRTNCAKIVAFSPCPLELKIPALELIAEQTEPGSDNEDYNPSIAAKAFRAALDERYEDNPPGIVFLLLERWLDKFGEHGRGGNFWRLYTDFDAVMEYIVDERLPRLEESKWYRSTWYEIAKCVPGEYGEMDLELTWILNAGGEIWHFYGSTKFLQRHGFLRQTDPMRGETIRDVDKPDNLRFCRDIIDIPTPFQPGDVMETYCWPFTDERYVVISSNDGKDTKCLAVHNGKVYSAFVEGISAGGRIPDSATLISPLYRARVERHKIPDWIPKNKEYLALKSISAAIKEKTEIGIEMEKYIMGDKPFRYHGGVQWEDFKENFGLQGRTDTE